MDEALAVVDLDISGRPYLVFDADFSRENVGGYSTEMTEEFLRAFIVESRITLHVHVPYGKNDHHKIEAIFKALARALKQAVKVEGDQIPSSKGVLA
jgi:imidazoleglycerol-phosphate dehydratase